MPTWLAGWAPAARPLARLYAALGYRDRQAMTAQRGLIEVIAAGYRADFERERECGDKLMTNPRSGGYVSTSKGSAIRKH